MDVHERTRDLVCTLREVDHSRRKGRRSASTTTTSGTRANGGTKGKGHQYAVDAYDEYSLDGVGIVRGAITYGTVVLNVAEDGVGARVRVEGRRALVRDVLHPERICGCSGPATERRRA